MFFYGKIDFHNLPTNKVLKRRPKLTDTEIMGETTETESLDRDDRDRGDRDRDSSRPRLVETERLGLGTPLALIYDCEY